MPRVREDEFLHFDRNGLRLEFRKNRVRDVGRQLFDELPFAAGAELHEPLRDGKIINRVGDGVAGRGGGKIGFHFHGEQQALRLRAFRVRHADAVEDFEVNDGNFAGVQLKIFRSVMLRFPSP